METLLAAIRLLSSPAPLLGWRRPAVMSTVPTVMSGVPAVATLLVPALTTLVPAALSLVARLLLLLLVTVMLTGVSVPVALRAVRLLRRGSVAVLLVRFKAGRCAVRRRGIDVPPGLLST